MKTFVITENQIQEAIEYAMTLVDLDDGQKSKDIAYRKHIREFVVTLHTLPETLDLSKVERWDVNPKIATSSEGTQALYCDWEPSKRGDWVSYDDLQRLVAPVTDTPTDGWVIGDSVLEQLKPVEDVVDSSRLIGEFSAQIWAEEFKKLFPQIDEGLMLGWFANAIMAGYDYRAVEVPSVEEIQQIIQDNFNSSDETTYAQAIHFFLTERIGGK